MAKRASPQNTRFEYLYRDASNYKAYGQVVFEGVHTAHHVQRLRAACEATEQFISAQVRVPSVRFEDTGAYAHNEDDHCWHEFCQLVATTDGPTDPHHRTIEQFVGEVESAAKVGWEPHVTLANILNWIREFA